MRDHRRRSIRLKGYDYSSAVAYFVTICTQNRECVLDDPIVSRIIDDEWKGLPARFPTVDLDEFVIMPNHVHFIIWLGVGASLADAPIADAPGSQDTIVMPTPEVEGVGASLADALDIVDPPGAGAQGPGAGAAQRAGTSRTGASPAPALGGVVGAFKSLVSTTYLQWVKTHDPSRQAKFWQRNYYEHIIRNDRELNAIRQYIIDNPANWKIDRDNLNNLHQLPPPEKAEAYLEDIERIIKYTT